MKTPSQLAANLASIFRTKLPLTGSALSIMLLLTVGMATNSYATTGDAEIITGIKPYVNTKHAAPLGEIQSLTAVSTTNAAIVNYALTFAGSYSGVNANNFTITTTGSVTGASVGTPTGSGSNWTVPVNTGTGDGTIQLNVANVSGMSTPVNNTLPYNGSIVTIDKTPPTITLTGPTQNPTNNSTVLYTVTFSGADIITNNYVDFTTTGTVGFNSYQLTGEGNTRTLTVGTVSGNGTFGMSIGGNAARDNAGNIAQSTPFVYTTVDNAGPVISDVYYTTTNADPATVYRGKDQVRMYFTTNEPLDASNSGFLINGIGTYTPAHVSGNNYYLRYDPAPDATLGPVSFVGTLKDALGNSTAINQVSTVNVAVEPTANITAFSSNNGSISNAFTISYNVTFDTEITGLTASNFSLSTTGDVSDAEITSVSGSGNSYTVEVNTGGGDGSITLSLTSNSGLSIKVNDLPASGSTVTIDKTAAVLRDVYFSTANSDPTKAVTGNWVRVTFSTDKQLNVSQSTFTVAGTSGIEATYYGSGGPGTHHYAVLYTVVEGAPAGEIFFTSNAHDNAGNETVVNLASGISIPAPAVEISGLTVSKTITNAATINYILSFPEAVTGVTASNFELTTTGTISGASIGTPAAEGNAWIIPVNTGTGDGTLELKLVNATGLSKTVSNTLPVIATELTVDKTPPLVTIGEPSSLKIKQGDVVYPVTVSEDATVNMGLLGIYNNRVTTGSVQMGSLTVHSNTFPYRITFYEVRGNGTFKFLMPAGVAVDAAGNQSLATEYSPVLTVDGTGPKLLSATGESGNANPAIAVTGNNVSFSFATDEAVNIITSSFTIGGQTIDAASALVTPNSYYISRVLTGTEPAGPVVVSFSFVDDLGNTSDTTYTAPFSIVEPATATSLLSYAGLTNNATVNYMLNLDRVVTGVTAANFSLLTTGSVTGASVGTPMAEGNSWIIPVNTGTGDGTIRLQLINTTNLSAPLVNGLPMTSSLVTLDKTPLTLSNVVFSTTNADATKAVAGDVVKMNFTTSEGVGNMPVFTIAGQDGNSTQMPDCTSYTTSRTILSSDQKGPIVFSAAITDNAGNITNFSQTSTITIPLPDTIGPVISNVIFTTSNANPAKAVVGDIITFTMTSNELLDDPTYEDQYVIIGNDWELLTTTDGFTYTATHVMAESDPEGFVNARFFFYDVAGNSTDFSQNSTINYVKLSDDNTLSNLTISPGSITPEFGTSPAPGAPALTSYSSFSLTGGPTVVTPTANNAYATITVNGVETISGNGATVNLANGSNTITVVVTAQNGTAKTYTITASVMGDNNAALSGLDLVEPTVVKAKVDGPNFRDYVASTDASSIRVLASGHFPGLGITVNGESVSAGVASSPIELSMGSNTITVVSTSQDLTSSRVYSIVVTRQQSANANLSGLELVQPAVVKAKTTGTNFRDYTATVDNAVSSIKILATASDAGANIKVNGIDVVSGTPSEFIALNPGVNVINVVVTAPNGTTINTYGLAVTRKPSSNAFLAGLVLNPDIAKAKVSGTNYRDYTASVAYTQSSIRVIATAQDAGATIAVNGVPVTSGITSAPIALEPGVNTIDTKVTAADGVTANTYSIVITRALSNNAKLQSLAINENSTVNKTSTTGYLTSVAAGVTQIKVKPVSEDKNAVVRINGNVIERGTNSVFISLEPLMTNIIVNVTAQNGTTIQNYILTVYRTGSNNTGIKAIKLNPDVTVKTITATTYSATVSASTETATIRITTEAPTSHIAINGSGVTSGTYSQPVTLEHGANVVLIEVTAPNSTYKAYTLTINREMDAMRTASFKTFEEKAYTPEVVVSKALSPNGDGVNDVLDIAGIEAYFDNTLQIMNSKGVSVATITGYDKLTNAFDGRNKSGVLQPQGTYYYTLSYKQGNEQKTKSGYFVLKY